MLPVRGGDAEAKYVGDFGEDRRHGEPGLVLARSMVLLAACDGLDAASDQAYYFSGSLGHLLTRPTLNISAKIVFFFLFF